MGGTPSRRWATAAHKLAFATTADDPTPLELALHATEGRARTRLVESDVSGVWSAHVTALHRAAEGGKLACVKWLVDVASANIESTTWNRWTALDYACYQGHLPVVQFLVERGANVEVASTDGWRPLHTAIFEGHLDIAKFLLQCHADRTARTTKLRCGQPAGSTPLDVLARRHGHEELMALLAAVPTEPAPASQDANALELLACGRHGNIYKRHDGTVGAPVVLKVLQLDWTKPLAQHHRALQYFQTLLHLHHPHIVRYHDASLACRPDRLVPAAQMVELHLLMEYCAGGSLASIQVAPPPVIMNQIVVQVLQALAALHEHDPPIQHFNIKPSNVWIASPHPSADKQITVKLADLGAPWPALTDCFGIGLWEGGTHFWSPERWHAQCDVKDDVWAAGLTLLYTGAGLAGTDQAHLRPRLLTELPLLCEQFATAYGIALGCVVSAMLATDVALRPSASKLLLMLEMV